MFTRKHTLQPVVVGIIVLGMSATARRKEPALSHSPPTELKDFPGVIDHSQYTYDTERSWMAIQATQALEKGDARKAEMVYRNMIRKYPTDATPHENLAICLGFQKRYEEARVEYLKALELNPLSARAFRGLGCDAYEQKRDHEAIPYLTKSLQLEDHGMTHWTLALIYDHQGERAKAAHHFHLAIKSGQTGHVEYARKRLRELSEKSTTEDKK